MSYIPFTDNTYAYNYPIRANNSYQPAGGSAFTPAVLSDGVTVATFQAGFPAPVPVTIPSNGIIPANTPALISQVYTYIPAKFRNSYAEAWNVAVQQAFGQNLSLQLAYVGNHGTRMNVSQNINLPSTYGGGNGSLPENSTAFTGGATGRTAATNEYFLGASSNYDSLQVQLTKRYSAGLSFTSAFTWGKALTYATGGDDNGGLLFFINFRRNYAPADFDRAKNFEQSFNYELPAGHGHKFANSGVGDAVAGRVETHGSYFPGLWFALHCVCQWRHTEYTGNGTNRDPERGIPGYAQRWHRLALVQERQRRAWKQCHLAATRRLPGFYNSLPEPRPRQHGKKPIPRPRLHSGQLLNRQEIHHLSRNDNRDPS